MYGAMAACYSPVSDNAGNSYDVKLSAYADVASGKDLSGLISIRDIMEDSPNAICKAQSIQFNGKDEAAIHFCSIDRFGTAVVKVTDQGTMAGTITIIMSIGGKMVVIDPQQCSACVMTQPVQTQFEKDIQAAQAAVLAPPSIVPAIMPASDTQGPVAMDMPGPA